MRFFITGSTDGLGLMTALSLASNGHAVVLHARNDERAAEVRAQFASKNDGGLAPEDVLVADLTSLEQTKQLADRVNALGAFDCIIHNAGVYLGPPSRNDKDWPAALAVNTVAPYLLTALIQRPARLVYVSSSMHHGADDSLKDLAWTERGDKGWRDVQAYSDTKFHNVLLAFAVARLWPDVCSAVVDPGWVPTKIGGRLASDDISKAVETYLMLALADKKEHQERVSGKYWYHSRKTKPLAAAEDEAVQDRLLEKLEELTGVKLPRS